MTSDAMDHIQEDLEEKQEQAEKLKEEKEELEERIEKAKEKKEEREELTEEILEATTSEKAPGMTVTEAQDQVKNMLNKLGLIEEEIKGSVIDELK
jgi:K+-transporting ATPase c subunit